ncbi:MAG: EscU/YscU/HrcU family type III secretion system export apparatus switch protein [Gammaproteobacteria bacterium]|nr:EscU/YscU/HrcU family type III secretion system export apparatus switch protein [Gammaproteobacteria bacterium]
MNKLPKFAIALEYDGIQAPLVTAKGHDEIANQILRLAHEANIPIQKDNELALVLDQIDLGDHVPEALYVVIAEILTFAYRLSGKHKDFMDDIQTHSEASTEITNSKDS